MKSGFTQRYSAESCGGSRLEEQLQKRARMKREMVQRKHVVQRKVNELRRIYTGLSPAAAKPVDREEEAILKSLHDMRRPASSKRRRSNVFDPYDGYLNAVVANACGECAAPLRKRGNSSCYDRLTDRLEPSHLRRTILGDEPNTSFGVRSINVSGISKLVNDINRDNNSKARHEASKTRQMDRSSQTSALDENEPPAKHSLKQRSSSHFLVTSQPQEGAAELNTSLSTNFPAEPNLNKLSNFKRRGNRKRSVKK